MIKGKYIVFANGEAMVFEETGIHSWKAGSQEVASAGYYRIEDGGKVVCYGESTTLGVKSRAEDADKIAPLI